MDSNDSGTTEAPNWSSSTEMINAGSMVADGWFFARHWVTSPVTVSSDSTVPGLQTAAAMKIDPQLGGRDVGVDYFHDQMVGRRITGLTPGTPYTISFDMAMSPSIWQNNVLPGEVGSYPGEPGVNGDGDHLSQVNAMIRGSTEATGQNMGLGMVTGAGFWDMEDYGGHERGNTLWIGDTADWDGAMHTHTMSFTPIGDEVALVFKLRLRGCQDDSGAFWIDNIIVTPEPAALALLGLGGLALVRRRGR